MTKINDIPCWICGSTDLTTVRTSNIPSDLSSANFAITDADYGITAEISSCKSCGFMQCNSLESALTFYETLEDPQYELSRTPRSLQAKKLLEGITQYKTSGTLLDVGAGSGILVEEALKLGYIAEGVEPSRWLAEKGKERGLKIHNGVLSELGKDHYFDVVMLIDVLEHVSNPLDLLVQVRNSLAPNGFGVVVTPDAGSIVARMMGWRWWHYRIAHIGYFNRNNLIDAIRRAGLTPLSITRPRWYFNMAYIIERINKYLPSWVQLPILNIFSKVIIPLNFGDSFLVVVQRMEQ